MSFTAVEPGRPRLNRSELAVPGSRPELFEKGARSAADIIFLDLEDSVAPDEKLRARKNIITGLREVDWGAKTVSVRINGLDTPLMYRDVVDVLEQGGERLDLVMIPKVGTPADVYALDMLATQIENACGWRKRLGFELIIETAQGMANIEAIAGASRRIESLHFGVADYAASTRARTTRMGGPSPAYGVLTDAGGDGGRSFHWGDLWHYALSRLVVAARAHGLRPLDGPFGDIADTDGFRAQANRAAVLGCDGKWAIHPSQIALANDVFTPPEVEVRQARRILQALAEAKADGRGAVALDGRMIDLASIRQAEILVRKADEIGGRAA